MSNIPVVKALQGAKLAGAAHPATLKDLCKHICRIGAFLGVAVVFYSPFGTNWINNPSPAWDANRTAASWDTSGWDWDAVDCIYFAMVTMTTVGYGDMPTLRQEMRLFTMVFGLIGVVFVAGSISAVAESFAEIGRKRFISHQRVLLQDAKAATALVIETAAVEGTPAREPRRHSARTPSAAPAAADSLPPSPPASPAAPSPPASSPAAPAALRGRAARGAAARLLPRRLPSRLREELREEARGADVYAPPREPPQPTPPPSPPRVHPTDDAIDLPGSLPADDASCGAVGGVPPSAAAEAEGSTSRPIMTETPRKARPSKEVGGGGVPTAGAAAAAAAAAPKGGMMAALPSRRMLVHTAKAFRMTLFFFVLCIALGEIENAQQEECGAFAGWACFTPYSCETWKNGEWPGDGPDTDRTGCWTWIDEIYYAIVTFITIGYGDVTPISKGGKLLGAFLVAFGVFCFTTLLAELVEFKHSQRLGADKTLKQRLEELREVIEQDDDGTVSPEEYIIFNLKKMGKVDEETLSLLRDQFHALDADGSGELDADDIVMLTKACEKLEAGGSRPMTAPAAAPAGV